MGSCGDLDVSDSAGWWRWNEPTVDSKHSTRGGGYTPTTFEIFGALCIQGVVLCNLLDDFLHDEAVAEPDVGGIDLNVVVARDGLDFDRAICGGLGEWGGRNRRRTNGAGGVRQGREIGEDKNTARW
jgi:hypothetical protein